MELSKQSLFSFQIFAKPIEKNFISIEEEFKRVNQSINSLQKQNQSFKHLKSKLEKMMESGHFASFLPKPTIPNQSVIQVNFQQSPNIQLMSTPRQDNIIGEIISDRSAFNQLDELNRMVKIQKTMSQTVLVNDQQKTESILNDPLNMPQNEVKMIKQTTSHKQHVNTKNQHFSSFGKQKGSKKNLLHGNNHPSEINNTLLQQINQIKQKLQQLQSTDNGFKDQIQILEKENDKFRRMLGVKKITSKDKTSSQNNSVQNSARDPKAKKTLNPSMSKKSITSQSNVDLNQQKSNEQQQKQEDPMMELQCFKQLREDIQKIKDYLNGKMKSVDSNLFDINTKIHGITRQIDIMERTIDSQKEDIQFLERTSNDTKLNLSQNNEKSLIHGSRNIRNKKNLSGNKNKDQGEQNGQKSQTEVQQKIVDLLDEMQRLKSQYHQILFGKQQEQSEKSQSDLDPQIIEKRKKLALKFNPNRADDQKIRKELLICRRDLKKLRDQFDYLMTGINTGTHETKTLVIKPNQTKQDWKSLSTKMTKLKQQVTSQIKEMQGKITANNQLTVILNEFQVGIQECKILLKKKLDIVDFQKTTKRIESRLNNFIRQTFEKEGYTNQQDALIAKKPWFCLSCDVELKTYAGKTMKSSNSPVHQDLTGQKFYGKKVNPESHMVRRNENGRLPSIAI